MKSSEYLKELRTQSAAQLQEQLVAAKKELFNLRFQNATNQLTVERRPTIKRFPMVEIDLLFQQFFSLVKRFDARIAGSPPLRGRESDRYNEDCR